MKRISIILLFALLLAACEKNISDFQYQNFVKLFGGGSGTFGSDVAMVDGGGYVATGYISTSQFRRQVFVARVDKAGNSLWQRNYGSEHNEEGRVVRIDNNDIVVAGTKTNFITGTVETFVLRLSLQGDSLAFNLLNIPNNVVVSDMLVSDGLVYIVGEKFASSSTLANYFIACVDNAGSLVWSREYGNEQGRQAYFKIFKKINENFLLAGSTNAQIGSTVNRISIVELSPQGNSVNAYSLDSSTDQIFGDAYFDGVGVFIFYSKSEGGSTKSYLSYVQNNSVVWEHNDGINGLATSLELMNENSIVLTCEDESSVTFYRVSFSSNGVEGVNELKTYPGSVKSILLTNDKGIVCVGSTAPDYGSMMRLIKTDKDLYLLNL